MKKFVIPLVGAVVVLLFPYFPCRAPRVVTLLLTPAPISMLPFKPPSSYYGIFAASKAEEEEEEVEAESEKSFSPLLLFLFSTRHVSPFFSICDVLKTKTEKSGMRCVSNFKRLLVRWGADSHAATLFLSPLSGSDNENWFSQPGGCARGPSRCNHRFS